MLCPFRSSIALYPPFLIHIRYFGLLSCRTVFLASTDIDLEQFPLPTVLDPAGLGTGDD